MNRAVMERSWRDSWLSVLLACLGIISFMLLFVRAMQTFGPDVLGLVARHAWLTRLFEISLGVQVTGEISINILFAVGFTHLVVLALCWGLLITICTRMTVGEIERGTADLLLTLPVSRGTIYRSATAIWALAALLISLSPIIGVWLGSLIVETAEPIRVARYWGVTCNLLALNLAVTATTTMLSCFFNRRGLAIATAFAIALASTALNFLAPFLPLIQRARFLGLLHYYRPVDVIRHGQWPWANIGILLLIALVTWTIGLFVFRRKDIPAS